MNKKNWCSYCDVYGCHSQRFQKFPDFFLTNVKFPWQTELTISQISPGNGLNAPAPSQPDPLQPFFLWFQQGKCNVYELIVPQHNVQKRLIFFETQHQLVVQFHEQTVPIKHDVRKMYKCTLKISLPLTSFKDFNFPWLEVKLPDFFLTLRKFYFPSQFPDPAVYRSAAFQTFSIQDIRWSRNPAWHQETSSDSLLIE